MSSFWKENPSYLNEALQSLHQQKLAPNEIVIVYEGEENPAITAVFTKWKELFTKTALNIVQAGEAKGFPACLNKGLSVATGDYIIRFDTDDYCNADRIEKQISFFMQHPEIVLISAPMEEYDDELKSLLGIRQVPQTHKQITAYAKWRNPFNHPSVAYKRSVAIELGGYPDVTANEDYAFFCNFLAKGYLTANLTDVIVKARAGNAFASRRRGKRYLKGEIQALKYIQKIGFYSWTTYQIHFFTKVFFRIMPSKIVELFYKRFLRK